MSVRDRWPSQTIYVLAAIGFAAGLGNLWRFPMLAYQHGGAAFIVALVVSNILIIYPLLLFETMIGQKHQAGAPGSMERMRKGTAWIQWLPLLAHIFVLMYYAPVMAWAVTYLVDAFSGNFLAEPTTYFNREILHLTESIEDPGSLQIPILLALIFTYGLVLWCLRRGVQSVSQVIRFTATIPFLLLFLLMVRGVTLPGAGDGIRALLIPDWRALADLQLWQAAIGQSFFSAGLAFGYFTMSGSHRHEKAEIARSSIGILAGNLVVSLIAGLAVFSTLGFLANQQGVPLAEAAQGGPRLVFTVLPAAIAQMPFFQIGFAVILFLTVITLAVDSIFAVVESVAAGFMDLAKNQKKEFRTTALILTISFLGGIPITLGAGLYYLDILDHFVGGYLFMLVGALECFVGAYMIGSDKVRGWINETATSLRIGKWFNVMFYLTPFVVGGIFIAAMIREFEGLYGGYPIWSLWLFGGLPLLVIFILAPILGRLTSKRVRVDDDTKKGSITSKADPIERDPLQASL